ncbi:RagB/SusD family nutrient uptake outer membrane protein, partial [Bacteroides thetaiotaomicron]
MKGKTMKLRYIFYGLTSGLLFGLSSCSLNYDPIDTYSDATEGVTDTGTKVVFKDKAAVESHLTTIYNQMRDRQEHWYVDLLLISDSHADNAYAGTTGAEVLPFENNSIEGSNSVLERDWNRYLEDVARANKLICNIDLVTDNSLTTAERAQYKAEAMIFRAMVMFDMVRLWGDFP